MEHKSLIVQLICQDFKYYKLISGLEKLSLDLYKPCYPENTDIIAGLLGMETGNLPNDWLDLYMYDLQHFGDHGELSDIESLKLLAEQCYEKLSVKAREYARRS